MISVLSNLTKTVPRKNSRFVDCNWNCNFYTFKNSVFLFEN